MAPEQDDVSAWHAASPAGVEMDELKLQRYE